jgi:hypothetical protein
MIATAMAETMAMVMMTEMAMAEIMTNAYTIMMS